MGFQGWYRRKYRHELVLSAGISNFSHSGMSSGALSVGGLGILLGGIAMLEPITCLGLVCLVARQSRMFDARSDRSEWSRTDLGFHTVPRLTSFPILSAQLDVLFIDHLENKALYQTFSRGAGSINGCRVKPTPDGHVRTSIADLHNTAESLMTMRYMFVMGSRGYRHHFLKYSDPISEPDPPCS